MPFPARPAHPDDRTPPEPPGSPVIWVLSGDKIGDNSQLLRAVAAMNVPYQHKNIVLKPGAETARLTIRPSLAHVDTGLSDPLQAPWPDLVVTVGRHLSCVALWLKRQSGGRTRIALLNAPRGRNRDFDMILVSSLYDIEDAPNIFRYKFPLTSVLPPAPQDAAGGAPSEPCHVLLIGGPTRELVLDSHIALDILNRMRATHASTGRIVIVTSRRTPARVIDDISAQLQPKETIYRWKANDPENPYREILACGSTFTVTGDSLSMLVDVARRGGQLIIAPLPPVRSSAMRISQGLGRLFRLVSDWIPGLPVPVIVRRNYGTLHNLLITQGYAVNLGDCPVTPATPFPDESEEVAAGLRALLNRTR